MGQVHNSPPPNANYALTLQKYVHKWYVLNDFSYIVFLVAHIYLYAFQEGIYLHLDSLPRINACQY